MINQSVIIQYIKQRRYEINVVPFIFFIKKCEAKELFGKEDPLNSLF